MVQKSQGQVTLSYRQDARTVGPSAQHPRLLLRQHTRRLDNLDPLGKVGPGSRPHAGRDRLLSSAATAEWPRIYRPGAHRSLIGKVRNMLAKLHLYYKIINYFIITTQNRRLIVIPCNSRAGKTVEQGTGYLAFIPADVPPTPPVAFDTAMIQLLSAADLALGRLSGIAALLPNPGDVPNSVAGLSRWS